MELLNSNNGHNPSRAGQIKTWEEVLLRLLTMLVDNASPTELNDSIEMRSLLKGLQTMYEEGLK